ncbi:MAG: hypothetical protein PGN13_05660 [Patulibacter minatonensis]
MSRRARHPAVAAVVALATCTLAACGGGPAASAPERPRSGAAVLVETGFAPTPDLARLITTRAAASDETVVQREVRDVPGQIQQLRTDLAPGSGLRTVVVAAMDPRATEGQLKDVAGKDHPTVVSVLGPLAGAQAQITLAERTVASKLAVGAATWANRHGGAGSATVIAPPDGTFDDWTVPVGRRTAQETARALTAAGFRVRTVHALGEADAVPAIRGSASRVVVGWNDVTALAAAQTLRRRPGARFVAAAGTPAPTGLAALDALASGRLQLLVGARLKDFATAIVDAATTPVDAAATTSVSYALPLHAFTKALPATRAARADYESARR